MRPTSSRPTWQAPPGELRTVRRSSWRLRPPGRTSAGAAGGDCAPAPGGTGGTAIPERLAADPLAGPLVPCPASRRCFTNRRSASTEMTVRPHVDKTGRPQNWPGTRYAFYFGSNGRSGTGTPHPSRGRKIWPGPPPSDGKSAGPDYRSRFQREREPPYLLDCRLYGAHRTRRADPVDLVARSSRLQRPNMPMSRPF